MIANVTTVDYTMPESKCSDHRQTIMARGGRAR